MSSSKKLRLAVIGCCRRGVLADLAHHPEDGVEIVTGADIRESQLERFRNRYREKFNGTVTTYVDYREMIEREQPDGVFITSPDFCHREQAVFCLEHKIPVYLEKPLAISIADADAVLQAARDHRTALMLGHNMRYLAFVQKIRELIVSGIIGDVKAVWCRHFVSYGGDNYFRDWHAERAKVNSLLLQKGAHDIDVMQYWLDSTATMVNAIGSQSLYADLPRRTEEPAMHRDAAADVSHWPPDRQRDFNPVIDVEDINQVNMRFANGVTGCYLQCHFTPDACRNYTVIGTRGRLENYGDVHPGASIQVWTRRSDKFELEGDITCRLPAGTEEHGGADPLIVQDFVNLLRKQHAPRSTPQAARYSVAAGCCAADSLRQGGIPMAVPRLTAELENYNYSQIAEKNHDSSKQERVRK